MFFSKSNIFQQEFRHNYTNIIPKVPMVTYPVLFLIRRERGETYFGYKQSTIPVLAVNLPSVSLVSKSRKFNQVVTKSDAIEIKIFNFQFSLIVPGR